ncbi:MAG: hypothetical protein PHZ19_01780 [Candidatus Thermoplasmatota archaeon]|nr:hypothetical protein [Candidatus Thermoplasmatota archaeon]
MSELREVAGRKTKQVTIDGQTYTLGSLLIDDTVEFEEQVGPLNTNMGSMAGLRWLWVRCLKRGGFAGTDEEAAALLTVDAVDDVAEVLVSLVSREAHKGYQRHSRLQRLLAEARANAEAEAQAAGKSEIEVMAAGDRAVEKAERAFQADDAVGEAVRRVTATRLAPSSASAESTDGQSST